MTTDSLVDSQLYQLGRASRKAAFLSLFGFLVVLSAIVYATISLSSLERERATLVDQQVKLNAEIDRSNNELNRLRSDLAGARGALKNARAAINAFHEGRLDEAVALYDEALSSDPENAYLQNLRAYTLFRKGLVAAAIEGEKRSIAADPNYAWGYFDLARFLCAASPARIEEAKQPASTAIKLRPEMRQIMQGDSEFQRVCRGQIP